jgi:hypothetical protein
MPRRLGLPQPHQTATTRVIPWAPSENDWSVSEGSRTVESPVAYVDASGLIEGSSDLSVGFIGRVLLR